MIKHIILWNFQDSKGSEEDKLYKFNIKCKCQYIFV